MITDLRGRRFKRNVYGPSLWEDRIKDITYSLQLIEKPDYSLRFNNISKYVQQLKIAHSHGFKVVPRVIGENTLKSYDLDEIIIYND